MKESKRIAAGLFASVSLVSCSGKESVTPAAGADKPMTPKVPIVTEVPAESATRQAAGRDFAFMQSYDYPGWKGVLQWEIVVDAAGMVKSVKVIGPKNQQQKDFAAGINERVVWRPAKGLSVENFSGASLTVGAFNAYVATQSF